MTKIDICKDVIKQLNNNKLKLDYYGYCELPKENYPKFDYSCKTCALGGIFLSAFSFKDVTNIPKNIVQDKLVSISCLGDIFKKELQEFFTLKELLLIESCFEQDTSDLYDAVENTDLFDDFFIYSYDDEEYQPNSLVYSSLSFGKNYDSKPKRLKAIMDNIIENGEFKP